MTASDIAGKLLEYYGPDGASWRNDNEITDGCMCVIHVCVRILHVPTAPLYDFLPGSFVYLSKFNDSCTWPEMKSWLEGIQGK